MASEAHLPTLPHGSPSILSGLAETFSFHASPESFITSRVLAFRKANPEIANLRVPIRAKILNRDIAVISAHNHVTQVLQDPDNSRKTSAGSAYEELMAPFFPPPNLLLSDSPDHASLKNRWQERMTSVPGASRDLTADVITTHFQNIEAGNPFDIYDSMKNLSWKVLLRIFLTGPDSQEGATSEIQEIEALQEDLLRGQFSLFPVSLNAGFWQSPRAKGLAAKKKLQALFNARIQSRDNGCPFAVRDAHQRTDVAAHLLLFTSSLAAKALASYLTALILNLYGFQYRDDNRQVTSFVDTISSLSNRREKDALLRSIILENERLSPPVVGIMRRTTEDLILDSTNEGDSRTLIPKDWDLWLYFVGAARDPQVFGSTCEEFVPERYYNLEHSAEDLDEGFAFGAGSKSCLGRELMREVATSLAHVCLGTAENGSVNVPVRLKMQAEDLPTGVKGWLGWQKDVAPEDWARDMKQLPTQRPKEAIFVTKQV
ncbi:MAG: hypothetical protein Q9220_003586 [cf. Caloplaca sp. 1 TL-2023]